MIKLAVFLTVVGLNVGYANTCTYNDGQKLMIEFNNLMQVYSRESIALMQQTGDSTSELENKRLAMVEESSKIGILMAQEYEKNNNIQSDTAIDPKICESYKKLLKKYASKDHESKPVSVQPQSVSSDCDTNSLWERYGVAIQKQRALVLDGKITRDEINSYMTISTYVGQYATTDLAKACEYMKQFEDKLAAE